MLAHEGAGDLPRMIATRLGGRGCVRSGGDAAPPIGGGQSISFVRLQRLSVGASLARAGQDGLDGRLSGELATTRPLLLALGPLVLGKVRSAPGSIESTRTASFPDGSPAAALLRAGIPLDTRDAQIYA